MTLRKFREAITVPWQRTLYITFFAQLMTAIGFSIIFPFLPLYIKELGSSSNLSTEFLAGMVFSAQAFTMMITSPIWGTLADRYGRKIMVERSMFGGAVILLLMAFVSSAEQLIFLRAIQGLLTGSIAANNALVASVTPRERTGYAMGLLQVSLAGGVALGPLIGGAIADAYSYSAAFYVTSALLFLSGVLVLIGVREEFVSSDLLVNGRSIISQWRHVLAMPGVVVTYVMRFMDGLGRMMLVPMIPLFIESLMEGTSRINTFTGLVIGIAAATATLSAVYLGRLGDRVGHRKIVIVCFFAAFTLYLPQSLVTQGWQLLVLQASVGVAIGGITPGISALLTRYTHAGEEGAVFGLDNSVQAGARTVAPLVGATVAVWFSLRSTFLVTASLSLLAGVIAFLILPKRVVPSQD
jgi:DHA1 family multidrug resistance protein-like MFS transporter